MCHLLGISPPVSVDPSFPSDLRLFLLFSSLYLGQSVSPKKNPDLKLLMVAKSCTKRMPFHTIYNSWDKSWDAGFRHGIHSRSLQKLDGPILPKTRSRVSDPGVGLVLNMMINNRRVYPQQFFQDINEVPPCKHIFIYDDDYFYYYYYLLL